MKTDTFIRTGIVIAGVVAIVFMAYAVLQNTRIAFASASSGLLATVATSSQATVTPNSANMNNHVFATSTCVARIVSSVASPLMLTFSDATGFGPTALLGVVQAASTTVVYDSGQYGCNAVRIYSFATSTITVMESR